MALEGHTDATAQEMDTDLQKYAAVQIVGPATAADFSAVMNDAETALEWLDRAVRMGDDREPSLRRDPLLKTLRVSPRFQQTLDSVA